MCYNYSRRDKCCGKMPVWWNWQTRRTQNPKVAIPCRFDPDYRHQKRNFCFCKSSFFFFIHAEDQSEQSFLTVFTSPVLRAKQFSERTNGKSSVTYGLNFSALTVMLSSVSESTTGSPY